MVQCAGGPGSIPGRCKSFESQLFKAHWVKICQSKRKRAKERKKERERERERERETDRQTERERQTYRQRVGMYILNLMRTGESERKGEV